MRKSQPELLNADLLRMNMEWIENWDATHESWLPLRTLAEFAVRSKMAPQLAEMCFLKLWATVLDRNFAHKQLLVHRGVTKTTQLQAFLACCCCEGPEALGGKLFRGTYLTETSQKAQKVVDAVRFSLESNPYIYSTYGQQKPTPQLWKQFAEEMERLGGAGGKMSRRPWSSKELTTVSYMHGMMEMGVSLKDPTLWAQGMEEDSTGNHMNLAIGDDMVGINSYRSVVRKAHTREVFGEVQSRVDEPGLVLDIGTIHADDDIHVTIQEEYGDIFQFETHDCWWTDDGSDITKEHFRRLPDGEYECLLPLEQVHVFWEGFGQIQQEVRQGHRFPDEQRKKRAISALAKKMFSVSTIRWNKQYRNRVVADEDRIFHPWMFKTFRPDAVPTRLRFYTLTDAATGQDLSSSYRVVLVVGISQDGIAYVFDIDFARWKPEDYGNMILDYCLRWAPFALLFEKVSWQEFAKTTVELLAKIRGMKLPRVKMVTGRSLTTKAERIQGLEPRLTQERMFFHPDLQTKVCDGKVVWEEMIRQFKAVRESGDLKGVLVDIPDTLSDVDALDREGKLLCKPPGPVAGGPPLRTTPQRLERGAMRPVEQHREEAKEGPRLGIWQRRTGGKSKLWG